MQTIEQLLAKVLYLEAASQQQGEKPDLICLTPEDELTLLCHEWQKGDLTKKAPEVRKTYSRLAGFVTVWDAPHTEVRAEAPQEKQERMDRISNNMQKMTEANLRPAQQFRRR